MNKKEEIIKRLKALKIEKGAIQQFKEEGIIMASEKIGPFGILYWLNDREKEAVKNFERQFEEYDATVFHVIRINTQEGPIIYMLYMMKEEKFENFEIDLQSNIINVYCDPLDTPFYSEMGTSYIENIGGGLVIPTVRTKEDFNNLKRFYKMEN